MNLLRLPLKILGTVIVATLGLAANGQATDQATREQARQAVRSQLHLEVGHYLQVERDEALEQMLAGIVARPAWSEVIYKVSEEGNEIKEHIVVHHIVTDGDPTFTIAINPASGTVQRIQGFADSLSEFNRLMKEANIRLLEPDQAEAVANFYRQVNPQRRSMARISSLLEFKQAAEWQCQTVPFDPNESAFEAWWKHSKPLYAKASFEQAASQSEGGYTVEWIVLSSPGAGLCGGAPLRARLKVGLDGQAGEITFAPLRASSNSHGEAYTHR